MNILSRGMGVLGSHGLCLSADPAAGTELPLLYVRRPSSGDFATATVPDATKYAGSVIYVSDGATGSACLAYSNGTNWLRVLLGAAVASS